MKDNLIIIIGFGMLFYGAVLLVQLVKIRLAQRSLGRQLDRYEKAMRELDPAGVMNMLFMDEMAKWFALGKDNNELVGIYARDYYAKLTKGKNGTKAK